jgi:uncharacterized protein YndB with AHSA1/START domain
MTTLDRVFDPTLDLVLERDIDVPRDLVWAAWTVPEHLMKWFVPSPWTMADCVIDLRPGGIFRTVMRSPEGTEYPSDGCFLEVVPEQRLVFTDALLPGYRPAAEPFFPRSSRCGTAAPVPGTRPPPYTVTPRGGPGTKRWGSWTAGERRSISSSRT